MPHILHATYITCYIYYMLHILHVRLVKIKFCVCINQIFKEITNNINQNGNCNLLDDPSGHAELYVQGTCYKQVQVQDFVH